VQTFLPYSDFTDSAKCLDDKRLGKQRVECLQILKALFIGPEQLSLTPGRGFQYKNGLYRRKTPWYGHPAVKMWAAHEKYLVDYSLEVCKEWIRRGFKDTCTGKIQHLFNSFDQNNQVLQKPVWLGDDKLHASHRSNLLRKNKAWYAQFNWNDPDNLEYHWPK
jgi:hypothetical protein